MTHTSARTMRPRPLEPDEPGGGDDCQCDGGQPRNFARPCLLLLLSEAQAHGYELIERMRPFGFDVGDPATIYRTLRQMERDGIVTSTWELPKRGPARRVYALTDVGRELLAAWAHTLERNRAIVDAFLFRFERSAAGQAAPVRHPERLAEEPLLQLAGGAR